jgi:hypothetical protein
LPAGRECSDMPQLTARGIPVSVLKTLSAAMSEELAELCGCGTDNFTIDALQVQSIFGGIQGDAYPFIEVAWFDRGGELRDRFAEVVTRHVLEAGLPEVEVAFKTYREEEYYINGVPCSRSS